MSDYDVVIIGAGNGGLTAALSLVREHINVLLLERHNVPGGCATSFVRGRFEFEVALHQLSGLGTPDMPGPLRELLGELGVMDKVEFVEEDTLYRALIPGKLDLILRADRAEAVGALKQAFPEEKDALDRFFDFLYEFCNQMIAGFWLRDPELSRAKYPLYFEYALKPSQDILYEYFHDPLLKAVLGMYWGYTGLPPKYLAFSDLAIMLFAYIEFKPYHIKGGSQALSNALLDSFIEAGGHARFNCGVEKIMMTEGRVRGVITEKGEEITTDHIISNASTIITYFDLIGREHVPAGQIRALGSGSTGPSAFCIYAGLDCEPQDIGIEVSTTFVGNSHNADRQYALSKTLEPPEAVGFTCYDVADPDFSPPGASQIVLVTLQFIDPWLAVPPTRYTDTKYRYAGYMLNRVDQVHPGLLDAVEEIEVSTPLTHMRYLGHPGGAIYGFEQFAKDSNMFVSPKSPIQGLFFAGAWAGSGGFQPTLMSGASAARALLKKLAEERGEI